jgi:beta-mannosidase
MARPSSVSVHRRAELAEFEVLSCAPGTYAGPEQVSEHWSAALPVHAPATVAAALKRAGKLDLSQPPDLDAQEHWFRTRLPDALEPGQHVLCFAGLATLCDAWVDGQHVLYSDTMFRRHEVALGPLARPGAEVVLRFASLSRHLAQKRPRPRWRTRFVETQQLRWVRTTMLGRAPGYCPRIAPVGPFREVTLETRHGFSVAVAELSPSVEDGAGKLSLLLELTSIDSAPLPAHAELVIEGEAGRGRFAIAGELHGECVRFAGTFTLAQIALWWPHTHGAQPRSRARIELGNATIELGHVAFRSVRLEHGADGDEFTFHINDQRVFARGAVWTTDDIVTLGGELQHTLELVRRAGMNMLRVGGTMNYERDAFYEACDALGILVWQDFMFANMDYPVSDASFLAEARAEVSALLERIADRPSLALLCGNSEIEMQVAMLGMPLELARNPLFYEHMPELLRKRAPGIPYVPSSASDGALPFFVDRGPSHYYGVGAYLRPLEDARRADLKFAAECLGFANVPCRESLERLLSDLEMPYHHPRWKERVPRDRGVGWDFDDVCDHYVRTLFECEPARIRAHSPERYLALSRAAVASVMEAAFSEWRRTGSRTGGALVWFLKDVWLGAGWGVIDADGLPKSAYYALARVLGNTALLSTDEGSNGVVFHALNETERAIEASLEVKLYRNGEVVVAEAEHKLTLLARSQSRLAVDALLSRFADSSYAYRFGPPGHDLVVGTLKEGETVLGRTFHEPLGRKRAEEFDLGLHAHCERRDQRLYVVVRTRRFAQRISIEVDDYLPADDAFFLEPSGERWVELVPLPHKREQLASSQALPRGQVTALNSSLIVALATRT